MDAEAPKGTKTAGLGAIFLILFLDILGFSLVLPFLAEEARDAFGTTAFVGTLLASVYSLMQFLFVPVWGRLSDRIGRRPVLLWSVFATSLGMTGLGLALIYAKNPLWLFLPRIASGIATANMGTASAYIADVTPAKDRARGMGIIGIAFGLGFMIGPAIGGALSGIPILGRFGAVPCFVAAALSLVNFAWASFGLRESLAREHRAETRRRLVPLDVGAALEAFARPGIAVAVLVNFVLILSFTIMDQTFRYFSKDLFGMRALDTGLVLMFVGVVAALVQGAMRPLTRRFDETLLIRAGTAMQSAAFAGLVLAPMFGRGALYGACALLAVGNGLTQPSIPAFISKRADPRAQGGTLGTSQSFSSLARMFGPALGGWLYGALGPRSPYVVSAGGMALACAVAFALRAARDDARSAATQ